MAMNKENSSASQKNIFVSIGSIILLIVILVAFVFLPASDVGSGSSMVMEFGRYGKESVISSPDSYFVAQAMQLNQQYQQFNIDPSVIWRLAFTESMNRAARIDEARRAGISVSQREAIDILKGEFTNSEGIFDRTAFARFSDARKQQAIKDISQNIAINQYEKGMTSAILRSPKILGFMLNPATRSRLFDMAIFYASDYPDARVVDFYEQKSNFFEKIDLDRIVFRNERDAKVAHKRIANNDQTFEDLTRTTIRPEEIGSDNTQYFYELADSLAKNIDAVLIIGLKPGEITKPIGLKGDSKNFAIYRAKSQPIALDISQNEALSVVKNYLLRYEKTLISDYFIDASSGINLDTFSQSTLRLGGTALNIKNITPLYNMESAAYQQESDYPYSDYVEQFKANFTNERGGLAQSLLKSKSFFVEAFRLENNKLSASIVISDDTFAVIRLKLVGEEPIETQATKSDELERYIDNYHRNALTKVLTESKRYYNNFDKTFVRFNKNNNRDVSDDYAGDDHAGHDHD